MFDVRKSSDTLAKVVRKDPEETNRIEQAKRETADREREIRQRLQRQQEQPQQSITHGE